MKRIAVLVAALVLAACSARHPVPGTYVWRGDDGTRLLEIHIIHGDCVAYNAFTEDGQQIASVGPLEKKGRYPHYTYRYRQDGSDFTITASFTEDGQLEAGLVGRIVWGTEGLNIETRQPLHFSANFQQTD